MKIIAVDIDDVLSDTRSAIRLIANKKLGINLEDVHYSIPGAYWDYYEHVWKTNGIDFDSKLFNQILDELFTDIDLIKPLEDSVKSVEQLSKNFQLVFVTSREQRLKKYTVQWLERYFGGMYKDLHVLDNKQATGNATKPKGLICQEIGASWLIDDNPEHCLSAEAYKLNGLLFGQHGWHFDAPNHLIRIEDWPAVMEYFDGIK